MVDHVAALRLGVQRSKGAPIGRDLVEQLYIFLCMGVLQQLLAFVSL